MRGMTGLSVRISRGMNKLWGREGSVFADRFHSRVLRSPTEVRVALRYVFSNLEEKVSSEELEQMLRETDKDGDGQITYEGKGAHLMPQESDFSPFYRAFLFTLDYF